MTATPPHPVSSVNIFWQLYILAIREMACPICSREERNPPLRCLKEAVFTSTGKHFDMYRTFTSAVRFQANRVGTEEENTRGKGSYRSPSVTSTLFRVSCGQISFFFGGYCYWNRNAKLPDMERGVNVRITFWVLAHCSHQTGKLNTWWQSIRKKKKGKKNTIKDYFTNCSTSVWHM